MTDKKEKVEALVDFYNFTDDSRTLKAMLENEIKNTVFFGQAKECIENITSELDMNCKKTILQVMLKYFDELNFKGGHGKNKIFNEVINEEAGKVMMEDKIITDEFDSTTVYELLNEKFGSNVFEPLKEYEMDKSRRGRFFIITAERSGYKKDIEYYKFVAKALGFSDEDVIIFDDEEKSVVLEEFQKYKEEGNPNDDCVIVACSSHGRQGDLLRLKNNEDLAISQLVTYLANFTGPKIFFIQACRGQKGERKASFTTNDQILKSSEWTTSTNLNDLLLVFATIPDAVSFRDGGKGSFFVRILKEELEKYVKDHEDIHMIELLTNTIATLATKDFSAYMNIDDQVQLQHELKQMACFRNSLTRNLIFKKKDVQEKKKSLDVVQEKKIYLVQSYSSDEND